MAEKIVKGVDIVEKGALSEHIEQAKQLLIVYKQLDDEVKSTASSLAKMSKGFKATKTGDVGTAKGTADNMNKALIEQERLEQAQIRTKKALLQLEKAQQQQSNKTAKAIKDEGNAYKQQSKTLTDLINRYQNLAARGRENGKVAKAMLLEINKLDAGLKKIDSTVGRHQRNVGNYKSALNGLRGAASKVTNVLGQLGLAMGVGMIVKGATDTIIEFDSAIADLSAITGASGKDLDFFKENAIRMGVDVKGGAAAVVEAYKLIASAKPELLENAAALNSVTEAAILLSRASGMELPDAATALTDAMNQFGVGAEQAGKFVDVLAAGAKFGSAEIPQITDALLKFGAVAKTTNVNIQESTGLIEALAEKGLKGAEAGTALRNVMLKLSAPDALPKEAQDRLAALGVNFDNLKDKSKPFAERLEALKPLLSDNAALIKVFGSENAVAATTLLSSTDRIKELTASVNENGVALEQANVRSATISEAFNRLKETINGVILSFVNGKGAAGGFVSILDFMTRNIKTILTVVYQLGKAFVIYKTTVMAVNLANKIAIGLNTLKVSGLKSLFIAQKSATAATIAGETAQKGLNTAMKANPIGLVIAGLVTLASLLIDFGDAATFAADAQEDLNTQIENQIKLNKQRAEKAGSRLDVKSQSKVTEQLKDEISEMIALGKTEEEIRKKSDDFLRNYYKDASSKIGSEAFKELPILLEKQAEIELKILAINQKIISEKQKASQDQTNLQKPIIDGLKEEENELKKLQLESSKLAQQISLLNENQKERYQLSKEIDDLDIDAIINDLLNEQITRKKAVLKETQNISSELSEMAKLEKQLQAIQLERSNLIIIQKGNESNRTLGLKIQERELQKQIDRYKEIIAAANKLERVAPRGIPSSGGGTMTTQEEADKIFEKAQREFEYFNDQKQKKEEKRIADQIQLAQDLTDITTFLTDRRIDAIDREIEAEKRKYDESKQRIDQIIAMRELDSNSMAQSIAFEKAEQAKALAAQEKLQRKKQRLELLNTSISMLNAQIAAGNGNPLGKTMADVTALIGFIKSIPMFWDGTETTVGDSVGTKFSNGRDGILARVDRSEMILNKSKVDKLAAMGIHSTDDIVKRLMLGNGISNVPSSMVAMNDNSDVVNELAEHRALLKQLVNKPVTNTTLEQVGKVVKMIETVNKPHRNIVTVKQKRIS